MSNIQILLITGVIIVVLFFFNRLKKAILDILVLVVLSLLAILFILMPELTNKIAHVMGVGRGADLIFYISILLFWFVIFKLYGKVRKLEETLTELVRAEAIREGKKI